MASNSSEPIAIADLLHREAPKSHVVAALLFVGVFVAMTVVAARYGNVQGAPVAPFIPICATLWGVGDLLTAFLLLTQFRVNGIRAFAILGAAYALPGFLTVAYIAYFPNVFLAPPFSAGMLQISVWLWVTWHVAFALLVGIYHLADPQLTFRLRDGSMVKRILTLTVAAVTVGSAGIIAIIIGFQDRLPVIVVNGMFTSLYGTLVAPLVAITSIGAATAVLAGSRRPRTLQVWLVVALVSAGLDGALNAWSVGRYTVSWYVGKIETLSTASVVLMVMLAEVNSLYRRLSTLATVDSLTGLANRQSFDSDARWTLALSNRAATDHAFLVIDIDFFKQYNDLYGHQAGDGCLRNVAQTVLRTCGRSTDLVARYGGEEFVVMLAGVTADGAAQVAENIRGAVEALAVVHAGSRIAPVVTVSVGVLYAAATEQVPLEQLFQGADAALYEAKRVRNTVAMTIAQPSPASVQMSVS